MLVHPCILKYLVSQVNELTLQFMVVLFGLNIVPWVFTKITREVASIFSQRGVDILMYLVDCLVAAPSVLEARVLLTMTICTALEMGFCSTSPKSSLVLSPWMVLAGDGMEYQDRFPSDLKTTVSTFCGNCFVPRCQAPSIICCGRAFSL